MNKGIAQSHFPVKINQKWGLMDTTGQLVVPPNYQVIGSPQKFGYTLMQKANKIGVLDVQGMELISAKYEEVKILDSNFISVIESGHQKIINAQGATILTAGNYDQLKILSSDLLAFSKEGLFGCVTAEGMVISSPKYIDIHLFEKKYLKVKKGDQYGLINFSGKLIVPITSSDIKVLKDGLIFYQKGVLWGAVDTAGNHLIKPNYNAYSPVNSTLIKLERFGEFWLFNIAKKRVVSKIAKTDFLPFSDNYVLTRLGERFGLVDYEAKEILANQYQEIQSFSSEAFRVRNGWNWGVVNKLGVQMLDYDYDFIAPIRQGRALINKDNFYGLVNTRGKVIVPAIYTKINISAGNIIKAFKGTKWTLFYLNENGEIEEGGNFKKHFSIKIQGESDNRIAQLESFSSDDFSNNYLLENFEWFYDTSSRKWGLRRLSDGQNEIEPTYDFIQIEKDLGYTVVGLSNQGTYRFDRTDYRFNNIYGIVKNEVGKLVTHLVLWDVRSADFRKGSLVARVVFSNGRHGLMLRNGKFVKKDFGYIGEFKDGLAKFSIGGKISAQLNPKDKSLGKLPAYLADLMVGSDMIDFTIHDKQFQEEAYLTCEGCSWGFLDTAAFLSIQPKYEVANDFVNDVSIVKSKGKWGMIDKLGNDLLVSKFDEVNFLQGTDNQIVIISVNSQKYGLMDTLGQLRVDLNYDKIGQFQEGRLAVKRGNLWGFVDQNGNEVIPPQFQKAASFSGGFAAVKWQRKWVFIDPSGKVHLDKKFRAIGNFKDGMAWVKTDEGVGYISLDGNTIIPFEFNQAFDFRNGLARVVKAGKYGLIDQAGKYILKPRFSHISPFDEAGLAIVRYGGNRVTRYGVINQTGTLITDQNYQKIFPFREGRALVKHKNGYGFIDKNGKLVIAGNYSKAASFSEGRAMVQRNNRCGFIDLSGKEIIPLNYSKCLDFEDGKAVVYEGLKKGGIIDLEGKEIIKPGINRLIDFKEGRGLVKKDFQFYYIAEDASWRDGYFEKAGNYKHGIAVVRKGGKWGIINRNGLNLISNKYDKIESFENGFAKVKLRQFCGLSDLKGNLILPPKYEHITYAGAGLFRIENGGKIGYLHKDGNWVWEMQE